VSSQGKNFSLRAIMSTIFGETADSLIFFPLALGGVVPTEELPVLILSQIVLKTLYEIIVLPITIQVVKYTKRHEGLDEYDKDINYNIFSVNNI
jgi:queuosine precursor transporter